MKRAFPRQPVALDTRGAAALEFAIVAPVFLLFVMALIDFGYTMYVRSMLEGALQRAARMTTVGNKTPDEVDDFVKDKMSAFTSRVNIVSETTSYYEYSGVGKPEKIKQDTAPLGEYNVGDCYEDLNANNVYDNVSGVTGVGGSDDVVYYSVTATFPRIVPIFNFMTTSETMALTATTVLRNQPYASQYVPQVKCT